jgi:hypothetical protein
MTQRAKAAIHSFRTENLKIFHSPYHPLLTMNRVCIFLAIIVLARVPPDISSEHHRGCSSSFDGQKGSDSKPEI